MVYYQTDYRVLNQTDNKAHEVQYLRLSLLNGASSVKFLTHTHTNRTNNAYHNKIVLNYSIQGGYKSRFFKIKIGFFYLNQTL